jgi:hypothetical protein
MLKIQGLFETKKIKGINKQFMKQTANKQTKTNKPAITLIE